MAYAQLKRQLQQGSVRVGANSTGALGEYAGIGNQGGVSVSNSIAQAGLQGGLIQRSADPDGPETLGQAGGTLEAGSDTAGLMGASESRRIDQNVGSMIGRRLGADFSDVRIHTDESAQRVADSMNARAFTHGKDIYFNEGEYDPGSSSGQRLLAHELTHTIQQGQVSQQAGGPGMGQSVQTAGNSVMQAKLKVGGSSTPAEAEADRVASQVMQGGTLQSGIPVTQSVAGGTVQRDFLGFKKRFQKAVDERNENYSEYKKLKAWERLKWAAANPLAWAFGRSGANQKNTRNRAERRSMIERLALQGNTDLMNDMASQDADAVSSQAQGAQGEGVGEALKEAASTGSDYGQIASETGSNIAGVVENDAAGGGLGVAGGVLGVINEAAGFKENVEAAQEFTKAGDKFSTGIHGAKAIGNVAGMASNTASTVSNIASLAGKTLPGIDKVVPGLGIATGAIKMGTAGAEMVRAGMTRSRTTAGMEESDKQLEGLYKALEKETDEDRRKKIQAIINRTTAMKTLMGRGHNTAVIDQMDAAGDMLTGALDTAGGIAELSGAGAGVGLALGATSAVLDKGKGWWIERKRKKARKEEVKKEFGINKDNIKAIQDEYKSRGINLSQGEVKKMILLQHGSRSYEEAYMKSIADKKAAVGKAGMKDVAAALGVGNEESEAGAKLIDKRLGVKEDYAGNLEEGIKKERARKLLPSWRR